MKTMRLLIALSSVFILMLLSSFTVIAQDNSGSVVITIENAASITELVALEGHEGAVNTLAFNSDGTLLASGGDDGVVRIWNIGIDSEPMVLEGNTGPVNALAFSPDGTILASGGDTSNKVLLVWDVKTSEVLGMIQVEEQYVPLIEWANNDHPAEIHSVVFVPLESFFFAAGDMLGRFFWYVDTQQAASVNNQWSGGDPDIMSISFSPDGAFVAMGRSDGLWFSPLSDEGIIQSDASTQLPCHSDVVSSVTFNTDGTMLASGSWDGTICLWTIDEDQVDYKIVLTGETADITHVAFSPDGTLLASVSLDGTLRLWNVEAQEELAVLSSPDGTAFHSVAFSPDGTLIATAGNDGIVRLWGVGGSTTEPTTDMAMIEGSITGDVTTVEVTLKEPVTGLNDQADKQEFATITTDPNGHYQFEAEPGSYGIHVRATMRSGCAEASVEITGSFHESNCPKFSD